MLENIEYSPTLYTRVAETKALQNLPAATKDRVLPILVARPWPNARELSKTWDKISEAIGDRRFALDLDSFKQNSGSDRQAALEFDNLFRPDNGFEQYYLALTGIPNAIPVLRMANGVLPDLVSQLRHVERLDRGVVLRLSGGDVQSPIAIARDVLEANPDCVVDVDCGWSRDLISREAWASQIVANLARDFPETEFVVTGSSFPDSFVGAGARGTADIVERTVFNNVVRQNNVADLTYGDWGSTRPPAPPVPMKIVPRIDLPTIGNWVLFRQDKTYNSSETYEEIAQRTVSDRSWPNGLNIWGTYTIDNTANGLPGAIRSPATATAARVNIHLHRQAYFGLNYEVSDGDEPFED